MRTGTGSRRPRLFWLTLLLAAFAAIGAAEARDPGPRRSERRRPPWFRFRRHSAMRWAGPTRVLATNEFIMRRCPRPGTFECFPNLPTGSKLVRIEVVAYDGSDAGAVNLNPVRCQSLNKSTPAPRGVSWRRPGAPCRRSGRLVGDISATRSSWTRRQSSILSAST